MMPVKVALLALALAASGSLYPAAILAAAAILARKLPR